MWNANVLQLVISQCGWPYDSRDLRLSPIPEYPHIARLDSPDHDTLALKQVVISEERHRWLNALYHSMKAIDWVALPRSSTVDGFVVRAGNRSITVFDWLESPVVRPTASWWARCAAKLHAVCKVSAGDALPKLVDAEELGSASRLLDLAACFIDRDLRSRLRDCLDRVPTIDAFEPAPDWVLSHGDLNESNVLFGGGHFKLIDFDRSGYAPREYDMQRMLWHRLAQQPAIAELERFWEVFRPTYEKASGHNIDPGRLESLYRVDFIKSVSWLVLVSNDRSRVDRQRQTRLLRCLIDGFNRRVVERALQIK